jgi:peptide/nickel transport system substrate-binding protein
MIEGADRVDFSQPPVDQVGASGYVPAAARFSDGRVTEPGRLILVRNPSWSDDDLRPAYPDRIEVTLTGGRFAASTLRQLETGELAFAMETGLGSPLYRSPSEAGSGERVVEVPQYFVLFMVFNTAVPPFDDVDVRRAVSYALDRRTIARLESLGDVATYRVAGHIVPDGAEGGLLSTYEPYSSGEPDLAAAQAAIRRSSYDVDGDGRCEAAACVDVPAYASTTYPWNGEAVADVVRTELAGIGIGLHVELGASCCRRGPARHQFGLIMSDAWALDYPDAANTMTMLFAGGGGSNLANLGRGRTWLQERGYPVESTPSVDDRIEACLLMTGSGATACWARLDAYLMTEVVPIVPIAFVTGSLIVPSYVEQVSIDQLTGEAALDRVVLAPDPS